MKKIRAGLQVPARKLLLRHPERTGKGVVRGEVIEGRTGSKTGRRTETRRGTNIETETETEIGTEREIDIETEAGTGIAGDR